MKTLFKWLIIFTFFPSFTSAATFTLPSGITYNVPDKVMRWFTLPSGIQILAEVSASELTLREQIEMYITTIAQQNELSVEGMLKLADCESKFNPRAYNPDDVDGRPKYGLFQYDLNTFVGKDIWNWRAQTDQTAQWLVKGYWKKWPWCIKNEAPELIR